MRDQLMVQLLGGRPWEAAEGGWDERREALLCCSAVRKVVVKLSSTDQGDRIIQSLRSWWAWIGLSRGEMERRERLLRLFVEL